MNVRDALAAVYAKHGRLTPQLVVDEARAGRTKAGKYLHDRLEWDDSVAGEAYRRHQAQELIRSVKVKYKEPTSDCRDGSVRAFHAVRDQSGFVYEPLEKVADDPLMRAIVLRDMEREWRQLKARYEQFSEFLEMIQRSLAGVT